MAKRKKRYQGCFCNSLSKNNQTANNDWVYIGKENLERWNGLKSKLNFASDQEFSSFLLDYFLSESSPTMQRESPDKSLTTTDHPTVNGDVTSSPIDNDDHRSLYKTSFDKDSTNQVDESKSTVIVINKPSRIDSSSEDSPNICSSCPSLCTDTLDQDVHRDCEVKSRDVVHDGRLKSKKVAPNTRHKIKVKASVCKVGAKPKQNKKKKGDGTDQNAVQCKRESKKQTKKVRSVSNSTPATCEQAAREVHSMKEEVVGVAAKAESEHESTAVTMRLCTDCDLQHLPDFCPLHRPLHTVSDVGCGGESPGSLAEVSLPPCLELREMGGRHEPCVVARLTVQAFTQFGPLVGRPILEREIPDDSTMEHIWEVCEGPTCRYVSTSDPHESNWLRYVRPAAVRSSSNLEAVVRGGQLVFVTTTTLSPGEELLFWAQNTNSAWSHKKLCKTKCGGCNLSFSHTLYYRLHCAVFHDPAYSLTVRKYHCKVCGMSVLGKENIVKHAAEKHNGKGAYQCQYCQKFFLRLNYLEMHRTYGCSANPNRTRPLCDYCGRKFCQPQKLKVHIKRMHSEMLEVLREFQCKHCLKVLGSRAALQRHNKEVHRRDIVGAFTCDRCGKMFQNKSNLKIHMLTHSGVKPFKCKEADCPAAFTTKQCLQFHYRKVHGLAESVMPPIERSIEYTFAAYAGGRRPSSVNTDSQCSSEGEDSPDKYLNEEPSQLSPPISVTSESVHNHCQDSYNQTVVTKGSKKWIGGAPNRSKTNVFDFDEDDKDQDIDVSQIEGESTPMLFHNCKQDSSSASLLVEAALDAAEREIDISSKLPSPMALVTNKEKEVYPELRSQMVHSPLSLSRPVSPADYPMNQSPLPMDTCYSTPMSPRHPYSLMFPERTPHYEFRLSPPPGPMDTFHLEDSRYDLQHRRVEDGSNDEGVNVVQNLSLGMKHKPLQLDIPYKYDSIEDRTFECSEGLDMSRTGGYHHSFVSMTPRYPPTLYEPRTYSHTDVLRVVNFSHSVDLSLPRSHHQLTPPMRQAMIEPIRIISPPPPHYQTYPLATSPSSYSRAPHSPPYHHYNTSY